ncbi:MAG: M14 family metallopeptidase, partial [Ferruginibacter sp.]
MKFIFVLAAFFLSAYTSIGQDVSSPDVFLGYKLGEQFTPHFKIVQYFEQAAKAKPDMMQLQEYGKTYENRPLLLAFVGSPENIARLEQIRMNNLRLAGMLTDAPADLNAPAIVWLSYNVHGNEASSSEVSMKILYEILSGKNASLNNWLKNIVVVIDPCLNPDGRERYVNWYTQMKGRVNNASPEAREHMEPWPGGRVNHYYFDLNRDWAWQTQVETQQRLAKYNAWLPQVHCDFHEQSPESPYYFAPAAEPFHEVITPWQREFQGIIGTNHAKYFDANGWLYFTKEYFDLFYPSYGDTYPLYNGAIGMTYEQAGHGRAGLGIALGGGDTLKLTDRIAHHFTTSLSTIEVSSAQHSRLLSAFQSFFRDAVYATNAPYKTYILSGENPEALESLKILFDRNGIQYGQGTQKAIKGYNYFTGKTDTHTISTSDLVVSTAQPKAVLIKVLFEPSASLKDSATYDITAWSLPYAYGIQTWATSEKIDVRQMFRAIPSVAISPSDGYGYLIPYRNFTEGRLLAALLAKDVQVRFAEKDFSFNNQVYKKGTLVILRSGNESKIKDVLQMVAAYGSTVVPVASGMMQSGFDFGSDKLHRLKKLSVAMLTGKGTNPNAAGEVWHLFDQQLQYPLTVMDISSFNVRDLAHTDVLILPDGNYPMLKDKGQWAGLQSWVKGGGKIIALENAAT